MVTARVVNRSGSGSRSSPGIARPGSSAVVPQVTHHFRHSNGYVAVALPAMIAAHAATLTILLLIMPSIIPSVGCDLSSLCDARSRTAGAEGPPVGD
jgi:hypothetical protein